MNPMGPSFAALQKGKRRRSSSRCVIQRNEQPPHRSTGKARSRKCSGNSSSKSAARLTRTSCRWSGLTNWFCFGEADMCSSGAGFATPFLVSPVRLSADHHHNLGARRGRKSSLDERFCLSFCWWPLKGHLCTRRATWKSCSRQRLNASEYQSRSKSRRTFYNDDAANRKIGGKKDGFPQGEMQIASRPARHL